MTGTKKKLVALSAAGAALVGGLTAVNLGASADAAAIHDGAMTVVVRQNGSYVASMCLKNRDLENFQVCTGKKPQGYHGELKIPAQSGDEIQFIVSVVGGHTRYYTVAGRDKNCYAAGGTLNTSAYCRKDG
jgi:hypothetical protein